METMQGSYLSIAKQLPLKKDDILFIASDIKQLVLDCKANGEHFNVNAFIESFQEVLSEGTLIIPAYTDYLKNGDKFDHKNAKPSTGALSNKVQRRKDFIRSKDPLHSVFAWGKHANEIGGLNNESSLGEKSVFDLMNREKAKMICINVDFQNSLTFVHHIEERENVNYRKKYFLEIKTVIDGVESNRKLTFHTKKPWVLTDLGLIQKKSAIDGVNRIYKFDNSIIQFFDLNEMDHYIVKFLKDGNKLHKISLKHFVKSIVKKIIRKR